MSILRKLALSIFPAVALALPLSAASSAQAHDHGHVAISFGHHWGYDHHVYYTHLDPVFVDRRVFIGGYAPIPVIVSAPTVSVYYRTCPTEPWLVYGSFRGYTGAEIAAARLQGLGFEFFIR